MGLLGNLRITVNRVLESSGFEIQRINKSTMGHALKRLRKHNFGIQSVVDVGAAQGNWTDLALEGLPDAKYLMVEALKEREGDLSARCARRPNQFSYHIGAAGSDSGKISFLVTKDLDGSGAAAGKTVRGEELREVPVNTIDDLVAKHKLPGPYLLKLDTHGFEVPILEGAKKTLENTQVLVIECYIFRSSEGRLLFWEMCNWLEKRGFRAFDLVDPFLRPTDEMLWQMDLFFTKSDWPVFEKTHYVVK